MRTAALLSNLHDSALIPVLRDGRRGTSVSRAVAPDADTVRITGHRAERFRLQ